MIRRALNRLIRPFGLEFKKIRAGQDAPTPPYLHTSLTQYGDVIKSIPGMIEREAAELLYALCTAQTVLGDVLEVGSWLGKSTTYLARAVKDSGNGRLIAVDHFRGNKGKESIYSRGGQIHDIRAEFVRNISTAGVGDVVDVFPMPSVDAFSALASKNLRMIFIDGDHREDGVRKDVELFTPLLVDRGIVVFDDFDHSFPGVIKVAGEWVEKAKPVACFQYGNMLICRS